MQIKFTSAVYFDEEFVFNHIPCSVCHSSHGEVYLCHFQDFFIIYAVKFSDLLLYCVYALIIAVVIIKMLTGRSVEGRKEWRTTHVVLCTRGWCCICSCRGFGCLSVLLWNLLYPFTQCHISDVLAVSDPSLPLPSSVPDAFLSRSIHSLLFFSLHLISLFSFQVI